MLPVSVRISVHMCVCCLWMVTDSMRRDYERAVAVLDTVVTFMK
jgi:hypothetical protein